MLRATRLRLLWVCLLPGSLSCAAENPSATESRQETVASESVAGHYVWGAEVDAFAPCGDTVEYWVTGTNEVLSDMESRYQALGLAPYEPTFARVRGDSAGHTSEGFAADYDGLFRVDEVLELRRLTDADCAP